MKDDMSKPYALRWREFNRTGMAITKQKSFDTELQLDRFMDKLVERDNFFEIVAFDTPLHDTEGESHA